MQLAGLDQARKVSCVSLQLPHHISITKAGVCRMMVRLVLQMVRWYDYSVVLYLYDYEYEHLHATVRIEL